MTKLSDNLSIDNDLKEAINKLESFGVITSIIENAGEDYVIELNLQVFKKYLSYPSSDPGVTITNQLIFIQGFDDVTITEIPEELPITVAFEKHNKVGKARNFKITDLGVYCDMHFEKIPICNPDMLRRFKPATSLTTIGGPRERGGISIGEVSIVNENVDGYIPRIGSEYIPNQVQ